MRAVIAAAAASTSRFSVTGSMSTNTGRARSYRIELADATNENGEVMTSSPSVTPTARSARCSAAVPEETADAYGAPDPRGERRSRTPARAGPSERCRERSTSITACLLGSPRTGRASGIT